MDQLKAKGAQAQTLAMALTRPTPSVGIRELITSGWMMRNVPELLEQDGLSQSPKYHAHDVLGHTLAAVDAAEPDLESRLTALLHDIGKPRRATEKDGHNVFYGHDIAGGRLIPEILNRLGFVGGDEISVIVTLHMRAIEYQREWSDKAVRSLVADAGNAWPALMNLAKADLKGTGLPQDLTELTIWKIVGKHCGTGFISMHLAKQSLVLNRCL